MKNTCDFNTECNNRDYYFIHNCAALWGFICFIVCLPSSMVKIPSQPLSNHNAPFSRVSELLTRPRVQLFPSPLYLLWYSSHQAEDGAEGRREEPAPAAAAGDGGPEGEEQLTAVLVPPHRVSVVWTAWVFFKTFFSSLIPDITQGVANWRGLLNADWSRRGGGWGHNKPVQKRNSREVTADGCSSSSSSCF